MRVLFLYDHLGYPDGVTHGLTRYCVSTLPSINRGPVQLTACFLREPHRAAADLRDAGLEPVFLDRGKWDPFALSDVVRLIRSERIDIVHAVGQKGILVGRTAARLTGRGSIIHLRDIFPLHPLLRAGLRAGARWTDVALGVSEAVCRYAVEEYAIAADRTELLYNGFAIDEFRAVAPAAAAQWRERLGIPPEATTIGVIGRLSPEKGHARLMRQMPRILSRVPAATLVVVGDGPLRPRLEALAAELGLGSAVRFVGQQDEIATVFGALHAVAIPSDHEGLSFVALEALAAGTPIVAANVGGLPEVLGRGRYGALFPLGEDDRLGAALVDVLLRERPRQPADLERHLAGFSIDAHVRRLHAIYRRVHESARHRRPHAVLAGQSRDA